MARNEYKLEHDFAKYIFSNRAVNQLITGYPVDGNDIVEKPIFKLGTQAPLPASIRMDAGRTW